MSTPFRPALPRYWRGSKDCLWSIMVTPKTVLGTSYLTSLREEWKISLFLMREMFNLGKHLKTKTALYRNSLPESTTSYPEPLVGKCLSFQEGLMFHGPGTRSQCYSLRGCFMQATTRLWVMLGLVHAFLGLLESNLTLLTTLIMGSLER